jgi:hypothetical protein
MLMPCVVAINHPCLQIWLIWPFLAWGGAVAVSYGMGYSLLGLVNEPMCLFNIVNYMSAGFKYTLFLSQVGATCLVLWQLPGGCSSHFWNSYDCQECLICPARCTSPALHRDLTCC